MPSSLRTAEPVPRHLPRVREGGVGPAAPRSRCSLREREGAIAQDHFVYALRNVSPEYAAPNRIAVDVVDLEKQLVQAKNVEEDSQAVHEVLVLAGFHNKG